MTMNNYCSLLLKLILVITSSSRIVTSSSINRNTINRSSKRQLQVQQENEKNNGDNVLVFGTKNGYDVGGTEPICWLSNITAIPIITTVNTSSTTPFGTIYKPINITTTNTSSINDIDQLNEELYNDQVNTKSVLLPQCFQDTKLTVEPINISSSRELLTGTDYTFRLSLEANLTKINEDIIIESLKGNSTIYARLLLCDVIQQGFCNPLRQDTRTIEEKLQPSDTDVNTTYYNRSNKYKYIQGNTLLGIHDDNGPIVFSRWIKWTLKEITKNSSAYKTAVNITFRLPQNTLRQGAYFFVGHVVMNFHIPTENVIYRIDIADTVPNNVVEVKDPPTMLEVSDSIICALAINIVFFGSAALYMFVFILYHRNHSVMKLTQGPFLAVMSLACMIQIIFSITSLPNHDIYCQIRGYFVMMPSTLIASILVGRVWRVYSTLSSINKLGRISKYTTNNNNKWLFSSFSMEKTIISCLNLLADPLCRNTNKKNGSFRQVTTAKETVTLIAMLMLPQIIVQVFAVAYYDSTLEAIVNDDETIGRYVCSMDGLWTIIFGRAYLVFIFLLAVFMAWMSKDLPSAFNEKDEIFKVASINAFLMATTLGLMSFLTDPTTNPDISVFVESFLMIGTNVCLMVLLIWPKISRVRSGEDVVIGNALGSKFREPSNLSSSQYGRYSTTVSEQAVLPKAEEKNNNSNNNKNNNINNNNSNNNQRIKLKTDEAIPTNIEEKLFELKMLLTNVTNKACNGRPLAVDEWKMLKDEVASLQGTLSCIDIEGSTA